MYTSGSLEPAAPMTSPSLRLTLAKLTNPREAGVALLETEAGVGVGETDGLTLGVGVTVGLIVGVGVVVDVVVLPPPPPPPLGAIVTVDSDDVQVLEV